MKDLVNITLTKGQTLHLLILLDFRVSSLQDAIKNSKSLEEYRENERQLHKAQEIHDKIRKGFDKANEETTEN